MSHVCTCDDCSPVPYKDKCEYEEMFMAATQQLVVNDEAYRREITKARAAVLALRDVVNVVMSGGDGKDRIGMQALEDTESYEQYR